MNGNIPLLYLFIQSKLIQISEGKINVPRKKAMIRINQSHHLSFPVLRCIFKEMEAMGLLGLSRSTLRIKNSEKADVMKDTSKMYQHAGIIV